MSPLEQLLDDLIDAAEWKGMHCQIGYAAGDPKADDDAKEVADARAAVRVAIDAALLAEREACALAGRSEVMKFRARIGARYYPGYHEDMRDAVAAAIRTHGGQP